VQTVEPQRPEGGKEKAKDIHTRKSLKNHRGGEERILGEKETHREKKKGAAKHTSWERNRSQGNRGPGRAGKGDPSTAGEGRIAPMAQKELKGT